MGGVQFAFAPFHAQGWYWHNHERYYPGDITASVAPHDPPPLHGATLWLTTFAVSLATFMNVLDTTIANVSIPTIAGDLGATPSQGTWVITSFAVANAISVPLTGWLTQRYGTVRVFVISVLLFMLSSLACGFSTSLQMLVVFRIVQGAVAGPMIPLSQALLLQIFPREKSGTAVSIWGLTGMIGPVLGPMLGGWISDNFTWPWIFYINIPTGLIAAGMIWRLLGHRETPIVKLPVDGIGLMLLMVWVGALQIMLDKGKDLDWFGSTEICVLAGVAAVAFCFFILWELTDEHPVVDLRLFRNTNFSTGVIALGLGFGVLFATMVLQTLWMQQVLGYTPTRAGLLTAPLGVCSLLMTPLVGKLMQKSDPRLLTSVSLLVLVAVAMMRSSFTLEVTPWMIVVAQMIQGAAIATFFIPLTALSMSGLDPSRFASAAGLSNSLRMTAVAIGVSLTTTLWDDRATLHHARLTEHITAYDDAARQTIGALSAQGMPHDQIAALLNRQVTAEAYMLSTTDYFWLTASLLMLLAAAIWLAKPQSHAIAPPMDAGH